MDPDVKKRRRPAPPHRPAAPTAEGSEGLAPLLKHAAFGLLVFVGVGALLLFASALVAYRLDDPAKWLDPLAIATLFPASFLGGFAAARRHRGAPLLSGLITAAMAMVLFLPLSLLLGEESATHKLALSLPIHLMMIPLSIGGAFVGGRKRRREHAPHPKKRK